MLQLTILSVSHKQPTWVNQAFEEYAKRFSKRDLQCKILEIKPEARELQSTASAMANEAKKIMAAIPKGARLVILDERGQDLTSVKLSQKLQFWMEGWQSLCIVIGGADGLTDEIKAVADEQMRLSSLTLPHGLVRVILAEQLYRAYSILNNHPYHRE